MTVGETLRIAIIGGGPAGLSLAIGLKQKGFQNLTVYEREKDHNVRHQGWSISLFSPDGGLAYVEKLGLLPEFSAISFAACFRALDGETGKTLVCKPGDENARRFKRQDLREALYQVCVREGKVFSSENRLIRKETMRGWHELRIEVIWDAQVKYFDEVDNKVYIHFMDPTKHQTQVADLLIGADGAHSPIRKQLIGDHVRSAGFNAVVGLITKEADESNDDLFGHELIKNSGVLVSGQNVCCWFAHHALHGEIYWCLSIQCEEDYIRQRTDYDKKKLHDLALEMSVKFFPLIQQLVQRTPVEQMRDSLLFKDLDPIKQHSSGRYCVSKSGRITLIGDAAHAMIPFRGKGGNTALMDAWNLCDQLGTMVDQTEITNDQIDKALSRYENERIPTGSYETLESREIAAQFHSASSMKNSIGNNIL